MPSYLAKVQKRMDIYSRRRTRSILTGNYGSVFKGRSMDFDDLREYIIGDDVKDIDWKASARSRNVMIRRYIAIRKRNILIIADSGRNMATLAPSGESKAELATFCAGVMAYVGLNHDDLVGMVYGNHSENKRFPLKENRANAENFLNSYVKAPKFDSADSNLSSVLQYANKGNRERKTMIIITDPESAAKQDMELLRKLLARHEIMFILIEDAPLTDSKLKKRDTRDIDGLVRLPSFMRSSKSVAKAEQAYRNKQKTEITKSLRHLGITCCFIDSTDTAVTNIVNMLEEQKNARKR